VVCSGDERRPGTETDLIPAKTIPSHFSAAVLRQLGQPLSIETLEIPPLRQGQVLVEIAFSGVCRSQLMEARGGRGADRWLPHLLGHEGAGTVLAVGENVTKVGPGDQVILTWIRSAGADAAGATFSNGHHQINAGPVTTFSTHTVSAENRIVRLPPGVPLDVAVLFGCALPTGAGMVMNELDPEPGSSLAVVGLGGIGLSAVMAARLTECSPIIAIDVSADKLSLAAAFGASHTINSSSQDPVNAVRDLTAGHGVDYCVEAGGATETIEQAFSMVRKHGGRCLFASHPPSGAKIQLDPHDLISGRRIAGSWGGCSKPDQDTPKLAAMYREGRLPLERLLTKRYRLDEVNQALDDLEGGRVNRPLLVMR
jgi:S-(hydroxymethyl)glutathione dehydrogenase/alcohol dehydrogenase